MSDTKITTRHKPEPPHAITVALWKNSENYHAGAVGHAAFAAINKDLWDKAEAAGVETLVEQQLHDGDLKILTLRGDLS